MYVYNMLGQIVRSYSTQVFLVLFIFVLGCFMLGYISSQV